MGYPTAPAGVPTRLVAVEHEGGAALIAEAAGELLGVVTVARPATLHRARPGAHAFYEHSGMPYTGRRVSESLPDEPG